MAGRRRKVRVCKRIRGADGGIAKSQNLELLSRFSEDGFSLAHPSRHAGGNDMEEFIPSAWIGDHRRLKRKILRCAQNDVYKVSL
ncbi:MAG: hypothetical protein C4520_04755 [Candidatus Abyssobacteria bacterium SURF_5]|uniref:Uncharacterized protein n=1 Tax=Abyssobacteria bacterium (strain SURF_5) TaxID=2093360 RepID=A0A3A4NU84_ABYX5|nr:MAG: hypothetical protein C4520_04755 [Candidatus Abyssubacteria bacterium SURF_5]